jgi:hypothetical protein
MLPTALRSRFLVAVVSLALLVVSAASADGAYSITNYGAVAGVDTDQQAEANTRAIQTAFKLASAAAAAATATKASTSTSRRDFWAEVNDFSRRSYSADESLPSSPLRYSDESIVLVPAGVFFLSYTPLIGAQNVLLAINGTLLVNGNQTRWQELVPPGYYGVLHLMDCAGVTVQGKVQSFDPPAPDSLAASPSPLPSSSVDIDGPGYSWWWSVLLGPLDHRPHLLYFQRCSGVVLFSLFVQNAPMFHVLTEDSTDVYVKNITIFVDVEQQRELSDGLFLELDFLFLVLCGCQCSLVGLLL